MDAQLRQELGSLVEVLMFQAGCTQTRYTDPMNPEMNGYIVTPEKLHRLIDMVVNECASLIDFEFQKNPVSKIDTLGDALREYFKTEFSQD